MVGWGIVGVGNHAGKRVAPSFPRTSNSRLLAVCSRDREKATALAEKHGAEAGYDSFEQMLEHRGVEVVYVATPHSLHKDYVLQAARAGKHVLCEKPLALSVADAQQMVDGCREAGVTLGVCFQNRFHPAHQEAKRLVAEGLIGSVRLVRTQYSRSRREPYKGWRTDPAMSRAGSLMGLSLHPLDLVHFVTGDEIVEVSVMMDNDPATGTLDEEVAMLLRLGNGGFALVNNARYLPWANNDLIVNGINGRVAATNTVGTHLRGSLDVTTVGESSHANYTDADPSIGLYVKMIEGFSQSVLEGKQPLATGEDGLYIVKLVEAILRSVREGRAVRL